MTLYRSSPSLLLPYLAGSVPRQPLAACQHTHGQLQHSPDLDPGPPDTPEHEGDEGSRHVGCCTILATARGAQLCQSEQQQKPSWKAMQQMNPDDPVFHFSIFFFNMLVRA